MNNENLFKNKNRIDSTVSNYSQLRYDICKSCEHFFAPTTTCRKCNCFMIAKTKLPNVWCPIYKW